MKSIGMYFTLMFTMVLFYCFVPFANAQVGEISDQAASEGVQHPSTAQTQEASNVGPSGTMVGLQASTNFQQMLVGLKIQMGNFAVTPKFGFFVQSLKNSEGSVFDVGVGSSFDYYLGSGKLRPYVGGDFLVFIPHVPDNTDLWFIISPHLGAEYWLNKSFSVGGNLGVQFGVGDSFYTPNTIGIVGSSDFSLGINGVLNLTYYF